MVRGVIIQLRFRLKHFFFLPGYFVACSLHTLCLAWLQFIHDVAHYLVTWRWITSSIEIGYCTAVHHLLLRGTRWNVMCSPVFVQEIIREKDIPQHFRRRDTVYSKGISTSRTSIRSTKRDQRRLDIMLSSRSTSPRSIYWVPSTSKYPAFYR